MGEILQLDYYYGIEAEQFSFYRVPRLLIKDERFKKLSSDAKLLYGLMLDRMSLSMKNEWFDDENRAYIIYTIDSIMEDLGCAKEKAVKVLAELDSVKGIGLVEKVRRGLGKPDIIYVKNFASISEQMDEKEPANADEITEVGKSNFKKSENRTSGSQKIKLQEVRKSNFRKSENQTSGSSEIEPQEVGESNPNYTNYNQTYMNQTNYNHTEESYNNPINQSATEKPQDDVIDSMDDAQAYIELIKENINYDHHMKYDGYGEKELYDELFGIICEVVCVKRKSIRVAGEDYPYELVKSRFLKLNSSHLEYVIGCMKETNTASRLYKYPFKEQLLIYAQRPEATACASIEIWNEKMHCWVNKGAKGIALIDEDIFSGLKYVFDISDVHKARRIGQFPNLWEMREEHMESVISRLEKTYGDTDREAGFVGRIREIAGRIAEDCYKELASDMEYLKEGSFLEELDELNVEVRIRETLADSLAYTVLKRCGMEEGELAEEINFPYIHEFNTVETLSQLGSNVSDLSKPILMEIGKAIGVYEREKAENRTAENSVQKGLANTSETRYNALKCESKNQDGESITQTGEAGERSKYDESDIREEWGLSDTDGSNGRTAEGGTDKVRTDEEEVLTGAQERSIYGTSSEWEAEGTPVDDTGAGRGENGTSDRTDEGERGDNGADESRESDALGSEDEQHRTLGRGDRDDGTDLQLNIEQPEGTYQQLSLFPSFEEQVGTIAAAEASIQYTMPAAFSLPQEQIDSILRSGGGRDNSRKRIYAKYQQGKAPEEMAEFLKNEYKTTGKGFEFDGNPVSLWFDEMGMRIGYGTSAKENTLAVMSWSEVESHIRVMVEMAENNIGIFAISTFNTDYVLIKSKNFSKRKYDFDGSRTCSNRRNTQSRFRCGCTDQTAGRRRRRNGRCACCRNEWHETGDSGDGTTWNTGSL